jgi:hypothetical protein
MLEVIRIAGILLVGSARSGDIAMRCPMRHYDRPSALFFSNLLHASHISFFLQARLSIVPKVGQVDP